MVKNKIDYTEISSASVTDTRSIVISSCSKGGFTIAQRMDVKEGERTTPVFMKGAFHVDNLECLYNLRDAINLAIQKIEQEEVDDSAWDDEAEDEEWLENQE